MRKRNVNYFFDTVFWYLLYFLPVGAYLISLACNNVFDLAKFFNLFGFDFVSNNIILNSLSSLFGADGILPIFNNIAPLYIFTWFVCTFLVHLAVDFLLFVPRLAHKLMDEFFKGD